MEIRNLAFWKSCPMFIEKHINFDNLDMELIGYFPYHTAKILPVLNVSLLPLPRNMFKHIECILDLHGISDNKAVYIFKSHHNIANNFALFLKDNWCLISAWDNVVDWDNEPINNK